jgi:ribonuclease BN (tRNA processing enzyme)
MSPPLFPVRLRELPCRLTLHDVPLGTFDIPGCSVTAELICHPGPTVGYRLDDGSGCLAYLPDHEPALGARSFPDLARWTSGHDLMSGADLLIHDCQYTQVEYPTHAGWGHSSIEQAIALADAIGVRQLIPFHHDPARADDELDEIFASIATRGSGLRITPGREGLQIAVHRQSVGSAAIVPL